MSLGKKTFSFIGVDASNPGIGFGTIEYWINLKVPMEQALRLYKVRHIYFILSLEFSVNLRKCLLVIEPNMQKDFNLEVIVCKQGDLVVFSYFSNTV